MAVYGYFKKQIILELPGKKKACWVSLSKPVVDSSSRDAFFLEAMREFVSTQLDDSKYAFELVAPTGTGKTTISTVILAEILCKKSKLAGEPHSLTLIQPTRLAAMMTLETLKTKFETMGLLRNIAMSLVMGTGTGQQDNKSISAKATRYLTLVVGTAGKFNVERQFGRSVKNNYPDYLIIDESRIRTDATILHSIVRSSDREVFRRNPIGERGVGKTRILHMTAIPVSGLNFHRLCAGKNLSATGSAITDYTLEKWDKNIESTHYCLALPRRDVVGWGQSYAIARDTLDRNGSILFLDSKKASDTMARA